MGRLSNHISFISFLFLGFILTPSITYAYTKKTNKVKQITCSKYQYTKTEKKDCCKIKSCKNDIKNKSCNAKCKHNSCKCRITSSSLSFSILTDSEITNPFTDVKKQKFIFKQTYYSSDYSSIWQPPKIS